MAETLYADIGGVSNILSVTVNTSHSASVSTALVNCVSTTKDIGDTFSIDLGYVSNHKVIFTGYVKQIERKVPDNTYIITAHDVLVRAIDYFVASSDPENPFKRHNIAAEDLVEDVLALAGLTLDHVTPTQFTFAVTSGVDAEVQLVSAYDYCSTIADYLTWSLWADENGEIHFENRKPYVMDGSSGQPGDVADTPINPGNPLTDANILDFNYVIMERDLRNRIVVYGASGINAEAQDGDSYDPRTGTSHQILPSGFRKSAVLAAPFIDSQSMANKTATYNLNLYNRLTEKASVNMVGNPDFLARSVIEVDESILGVTKDMYIFLAEHNWSKNGYQTVLELNGG